MSQQIFDIDTVGFNDNTLGNYFDFYVNNTFYLWHQSITTLSILSILIGVWRATTGGLTVSITRKAGLFRKECCKA